MPKDLKVGQRVRVYGFGPALDVLTGVVSRTYGERPIVSVDPGGGRGHIAAHVGQCRRLKPRAKSVMVTRKMLNGIWEDRVSKDRYTLKLLCRALGLDEARP